MFESSQKKNLKQTRKQLREAACSIDHGVPGSRMLAQSWLCRCGDTDMESHSASLSLSFLFLEWRSSHEIGSKDVKTFYNSCCMDWAHTVAVKVMIKTRNEDVAGPWRS
jgi:hypothetical protein